MLSVRPREQQVAEKPYGEHLCTSSSSSTKFIKCQHEIREKSDYFFRGHQLACLHWTPGKLKVSLDEKLKPFF